jgi:hypothetical protein
VRVVEKRLNHLERHSFFQGNSLIIQRQQVPDLLFVVNPHRNEQLGSPSHPDSFE